MFEGYTNYCCCQPETLNDIISGAFKCNTKTTITLDSILCAKSNVYDRYLCVWLMICLVVAGTLAKRQVARHR